MLEELSVFRERLAREVVALYFSMIGLAKGHDCVIDAGLNLLMTGRVRCQAATANKA